MCNHRGLIKQPCSSSECEQVLFASHHIRLHVTNCTCSDHVESGDSVFKICGTNYRWNLNIYVRHIFTRCFLQNKLNARFILLVFIPVPVSRVYD